MDLWNIVLLGQTKYTYIRESTAVLGEICI